MGKNDRYKIGNGKTERLDLWTDFIFLLPREDQVLWATVASVAMFSAQNQ